MESSDIVAIATKVGEIASTVDVTNLDPVQVAAYMVILLIGDGFIHGGISRNPWVRQLIAFGIKKAWEFGVNAWNNRKKDGK